MVRRGELLLAGVGLMLYAPLEAAYIAYAARPAYDAMLGKIQRGVPASYGRVYAAALAYAALLVPWHFLVLRPMRTGLSQQQVLARALLLGVAVYGVYNATNLLLFDAWDPAVALMDTCWGISVLVLVSWLLYWMHTKTRWFT